MNCLSVFDHFLILALKGSTSATISYTVHIRVKMDLYTNIRSEGSENGSRIFRDIRLRDEVVLGKKSFRYMMICAI